MSEEQKSKIDVWTEKARLFRVIHVDGAHGGVSPSGQAIVMSLFSERRPLPKHEVFEITKGSEDRVFIGQRVSPDKDDQENKSGLFREVEVSAVMDLPTAKAIYQWLSEKIPELESTIVNLGEIPKKAKY